MERYEWIWEDLSEGTSKASEKLLVLGGSFDELNGNFFKEGIGVLGSNTQVFWKYALNNNSKLTRFVCSSNLL